MADHEHTSDSCHEIELHKLCRVCARKINKGYKHKCSASGSLLGPFGVRISCDKPDTHPIFYCHNCHTIAKHLEKDRASETTFMAHNWSGHSDHECEVCCMSSSLHNGGIHTCTCTCINNAEINSFTSIMNNLRGKRVRIFMSGDYEFLSRMYGITGAQGTHKIARIQN